MSSDSISRVGLSMPRGFQVGGVACGIKASGKPDVSLILTDQPAVAAGVYTTNRVCAAPVILDRQRTPMEGFRAVITNSGNANACTGEQGMLDSVAMTEMTARACGVSADQVLVMSTGIIGEHLDMKKVQAGILSVAENLGSATESLFAAADGFLTTDLVRKVASRTFELGGEEVTITGIAKGSGMIAPNMATMLGVIMTDAKLSSATAEALLRTVCESTFNAISVDGHTSTNDTVLLVASGAAQTGEIVDADIPVFQTELANVCSELAHAIVDDGEGATHVMEINVTGCSSGAEAMTIAKAIGASPLVKTAIAGADPNWGRIVSAAGYAGPTFDPIDVTLRVNGNLLFEMGAPVSFDHAEVSSSMKSNRVINIEISFKQGDSSACFKTCDLTAEYVRINAEYHT